MHLSAVAVDLDVGHLFETVTFHQFPGILLLQLEGLLTSLESYSLATGLLMHHLAWEHSVRGWKGLASWFPSRYQR